MPGDLTAHWQTETGGPISASPTYRRGIVFVGNNTGWLYALRATDGHVVWRHHVSNALMSAPLLYHGLVIAGEGNADSVGPTPEQPLVAGTRQSAIIAFDAQTGVIRWRTALAGSGMPSPAIIDGVLVHPDGAGDIVAMDPITGHLLYVQHLHSVASMTAALPVGTHDYVSAGVLQNSVWRIDARSGRVLWSSNPFPANASGIGDCPLASDGTRVFGDYVMSMPPYTGRLVWHTQVRGVVKGGFVLTGGAVYFGREGDAEQFQREFADSGRKNTYHRQ